MRDPFFSRRGALASAGGGGGGGGSGLTVGGIDISTLTPYAEEDLDSIRASGTGLSGTIAAGPVTTLVTNFPSRGLLSFYDIPRDIFGEDWVQGSSINTFEGRLIHNLGQLTGDGLGIFVGIAFSSSGTGTDGRPVAYSEVDAFLGPGIIRQTASSLRTTAVHGLNASVDGSQAETGRVFEVCTAGLRSPNTITPGEFRIGQVYSGSKNDATDEWIAGAFQQNVPNIDVDPNTGQLVLFSVVYRYQATTGVRSFAPLTEIFIHPGA